MLQREIGPLALERVREDVRHHSETILQHIRPIALVPHRAERERTSDGSGSGQRQQQMRRGHVLPHGGPVNCRLRRKLCNARIREDSALEDLAKGIRQGLLRDESGRRIASVDDPLMRVLQNLSVGRPLKQVAAINTEELDQRPERPGDLGIHVRGCGVDEPGGEISEKPLEGAPISFRQKGLHDFSSWTPSYLTATRELPTCREFAFVQGGLRPCSHERASP